MIVSLFTAGMIDGRIRGEGTEKVTRLSVTRLSAERRCLSAERRCL